MGLALLETWLAPFRNGAKPQPDVGIAPSDSASVDAFGRLRVSEPADLFETQFEFDNHPLLWETFTTGSAAVAHNYNKSSVDMMVSGSSSVVVRQTRGYFRYQPGKSHMMTLTYEHEPTFDTLWRVGYLDDRDGIFLEHSGTSTNIVLRSSVSGDVVETRIQQSEWNWDRFDGLNDTKFNPSGIKLDHAMSQHLAIDLQWQGVGRARVGFFIDGVIHVAHKFRGSNAQAGPFMRTANLPIRYELRGLPGIAQQRTSLQICQALTSEGGVTDERGQPFSAAFGITGSAVTTRVPLMTIRPTALHAGHVNRTMMVPQFLTIMTDNDPVYWELIHGGVLVSGSVSWVPVNDESAIEMDRGATLISGGLRVQSGYVSLSAGGAASGHLIEVIRSKLRLALDIQGAHPTAFPTDNLSIVVTRIGAGTTNVHGTIEGVEFH